MTTVSSGPRLVVSGIGAGPMNQLDELSDRHLVSDIYALTVSAGESVTPVAGQFRQSWVIIWQMEREGLPKPNNKSN